MNSIVEWLEAHEALSGWAQFAGAMLALVVTYFTAFAPTWSRKRHLRLAAKRVLKQSLFAIKLCRDNSLQGEYTAALAGTYLAAMKNALDELARFPIYELADPENSETASRMNAMAFMLSNNIAQIEAWHEDVRAREIKPEDRMRLHEMFSIIHDSAERLTS